MENTTQEKLLSENLRRKRFTTCRAIIFREGELSKGLGDLFPRLLDFSSASLKLYKCEPIQNVRQKPNEPFLECIAP
jgi:hypothetical protein